MADQESQVSFEGGAGMSPEGLQTSVFEVNAIARYSGNMYDVGPAPETWDNLHGLAPDLKQSEPGFRPLVRRDTELGFNYFEFAALEGSGDFYKTDTSYTFPAEITLLFLMRVRLDREAPGPRALRRVGTLLGLGNRDVQLFYDLTQEQTDIQTRLPGGHARFTAQEGSDPSWRVYVLVFGAPYGEAVLDTSLVLPTSLQEPSEDASGTFPLTVGQDPAERGYLDADIAEIRIYNGRASSFELLDLADALTTSLTTSTGFEGVGTFGVGEGLLDIGGSVDMEGVGSMQNTPWVNPGDFPDLLAWHDGQDSRLAALEPCDRVLMWYDSSGNVRDVNMEVFELCQPWYDPAFYNGGGALKFPKEGRGVVSCIFSGLECEPYTIFILGRGATSAGFRCFYRIGNAIGIGLKQNASNRSLDDLIITTNPGHVASRQVIYEGAVTRGEFFELLLQGQDGGAEWTLDVSVNRVLLVPTSVESNEEPDPIEITDPCVPGVVFEPEDPYTVPYTKTFKLERDGYIYIGEGNCPAYAQILWWSRVLDGADLTLLYGWLDGRYPPAP